MGRATLARSAAALAAAALVALCGAARAATFDYLYIEANEGSSSGGHAAIRFAERTFHFQNRDGLLVLDRESTRDFLHDYALVNNRTIRASRIEVSAEDWLRIRTQFDRRHYLQRRQLDVLESLREDRALLERWRRAADGSDPGEASPDLPGLGYFAGFRVGSGTSSSSPRLRALRERIEERSGTTFLSERRSRARARLSAIASADPAAWKIRTPRHRYDDPPFEESWARSYRDVATSLAAIDVLQAAVPLAASAIVAPAGAEYWLEPRETQRLQRAVRELEEQLVRLARSQRVDWGRPFLAGLARLLAFDESLARRRWVFLDVLPEDTRRLDYRVIAPRLDLVAEMLRAGSDQVEAARLAWVADNRADERAWGRLEEAANRVHELSQAVRERRELRLARGTRVPSRRGRLTGSLPRATDAREIEASLQRVAAREHQVRASLEELYRYHLITRNCVSELFHTLNEGLGQSVARSQAALGGHIDGASSLAFVPFVAAATVDARYRVVEKRVLPSYREIRLAQMRDRESAWWVAIRESNTLTARSYRRGHQDSFFLFFTDDAFALRPLFGVLNLTVALGESLWGLVRLPVDGGDTLVSGLEGALVSLPELAFGNIRKGSNDWVAARRGSLDD